MKPSRILHSFFFLILLAAPAHFFSQSVPTPGKKQELPVIFTRATLHIGNGQVVENGEILFMDGKIVEVGKVNTVFKNARVIDLQGKHVYPGFIALNTQIGLGEIEAVRATNDMGEVGNLNPNLRAIVGYNTDSRVTPTIRNNGILLAQTVPTNGVIPGQSALVQLDAWNWEDAAVLSEDALHINWPGMDLNEGPKAPPADEQRRNISMQIGVIEKAFEEASAYLAGKEKGALKATDLRWEAMIPYLKKEKPVFIHADSEKQLRAVLSFQLKTGLRIVIVGAEDAFRVAGMLKQQNIPVVLGETHSLPRKEGDDVDQPFVQPKQLTDAGVLVALSGSAFWDQRNLPFLAGTAVSRGLTKEQALQTLTLNPAKMLGIDNRLGSLEPGKEATLFVSSGDALDMMGNQVVMAFINGRELDLGSRQKDLYEKFRQKP